MRRRPTSSILVYLACSLALLAGAVVAWTAKAADDPLREAPVPTKVRDLDYGDVLFYFFQDDYFESIVRLEADRDFGRFVHHGADADLLAGGLYLSLGLHNEASRVFDKLLAGNVPPAVQDRARFYLARINYQRGHHEEALRQLDRVRGALPGKLEPERRLLEANVLMALGRFGDAATRLAAWTDTTGWSNYARFNLGVAQVRSGDLTQGRIYLEQVGTLVPRNEEQAALRDRANLALGFALLQQHGADDAEVALSRVRLDGPFTNRALLALGWAEANANRPERALVPWLELQQRRVTDASVQESLLAVPYAYVRLASNGQASQFYRQAVDAYATEGRRLGQSIDAIRKPGFLDAVLANVPKDPRPGWFWQLDKLPDAPQTRYLYTLLASHAFQEGLKNYRDLRLMQANLGRWRDSLDAFDTMIDARERAAERREPMREQALAQTDLGPKAAELEQIATRLTTVASQRDLRSLATPAERAQWDALDRIDARLATLPGDAHRAELTERARLLRGTLTWQADHDFKVRVAQAKRDLADARTQLAQAQQHYAGIGAAADIVPRNTAGFAARVAELRRRIDRMGPAIDAAQLAQQRVLADLAVAELQAQQRRLASYATQAQFALAALYDGAASHGGGK